MNLIETATDLFQNQLGDSADLSALPDALTGLLSNEDGELDLGSLMSRFTSEGGLGSLVQSWLGDGENSPFSLEQVQNIFGEDAIAQFAEQVGIDPEAATSGLSEVLPQLVDQFSDGGSLLENLGGVDGLLDTAKSLFNRFS